MKGKVDFPSAKPIRVSGRPCQDWRETDDLKAVSFEYETAQK